jgi:hypothetical protein
MGPNGPIFFFFFPFFSFSFRQESFMKQVRKQ